MATTTCRTVTFDGAASRRLEVITAYFQARNQAAPEMQFDTGFSSVVRYCINKAFRAGVDAGLWKDLQ